MIRQRLMAVVAGSALAAGGTAVAAHAAVAADTGNHGDNRPDAPSAGPATPQQETQTVAGVGTVTFTVDPATETITNVMVMPVTGVTAGTPVIGDKTISIPITLADGTMQTLQVQVDVQHDHSVVRVRTELRNEPEIDAVEVERPEAADVEVPDAAEPAEAPEAAEAPDAPEVEHHDGQTAGDGHDNGSPAVSPGPSSGDHSGSQGDGGSGGGGHDGGSGDGGSGGGGQDGAPGGGGH